MAAVGPKAHLGHLEQDAALHGLEAVTSVGQRPGVDDGLAVLEERALHLGRHIDIGRAVLVGLGLAGNRGILGSSHKIDLMLPALKADRLSLADVFPSCLAALSGEPNALSLPKVATAVVLLVDGLGAAALKARSGHARTLAGASGTIDSGFPTTTASSLATLTTGTRPGQHGMVGYSVLDPSSDRLIVQLSGLGTLADPVGWQRSSTVFERAKDAGYRATVIAPQRYMDSDFTHAVLRGAQFVVAATIAERLEAAARLASSAGSPQLIYVYVPELDKAGHAHGWESDQWTHALEAVDSAVRSFTAAAPTAGLVVTADHGVIDVPPHAHVLYDAEPELMTGVAHVGGEPRCLQLYFAPDASTETRESTITAWRESEAARSWVLTRAETVEAGWFGDVDPAVMPRIGDLIVAARKGIAYYSVASSPRSRAMVGQHGSWSPAELQVPLLRFGAFAPR